MGDTRLLIASHLDLSLKRVSDLLRTATPDPVNISDNFSQREFTVALLHLKALVPDDAPGPVELLFVLLEMASTCVAVSHISFMERVLMIWSMWLLILCYMD